MSDQRKRNLSVGVVLLLSLLAVGYFWLERKPDKPLNLIPLRFASVPAVIEAPSHVAYKKGYFAAEGLDLTMEINPDGKTSLDHLMDGQVDIAAVCLHLCSQQAQEGALAGAIRTDQADLVFGTNIQRQLVKYAFTPQIEANIFYLDD